jgi:hypothetical protein
MQMLLLQMLCRYYGGNEFIDMAERLCQVGTGSKGDGGLQIHEPLACTRPSSNPLSVLAYVAIALQQTAGQQRMATQRQACSTVSAAEAQQATAGCVDSDRMHGPEWRLIQLCVQRMRVCVLLCCVVCCSNVPWRPSVSTLRSGVSTCSLCRDHQPTSRYGTAACCNLSP